MAAVVHQSGSDEPENTSRSREPMTAFDTAVWANYGPIRPFETAVWPDYLSELVEPLYNYYRNQSNGE